MTDNKTISFEFDAGLVAGMDGTQPVTGEHMLAAVQAALVGAGWQAVETPYPVVTSVWQCSCLRNDVRVEIAGEFQAASATTEAVSHGKGTIAVEVGGKRGFLDMLLGRNKLAPNIEAECQNSILDTLANAPGFENVRLASKS